MRISDDYPINAKPINWREQYIIDEAKAWLDENAFKSSMNIDEHVNNVIDLGRDAVIPFMMELLRENINDGIYMHFCCMVINEFLKDEIKVEGYVPITEWAKTVLNIYDFCGFKYDSNNN